MHFSFIQFRLGLDSCFLAAGALDIPDTMNFADCPAKNVATKVASATNRFLLRAVYHPLWAVNGDCVLGKLARIQGANNL